jgi:hypothetical protein
MKIAGQHTPFWGGQHGRFLQLSNQQLAFSLDKSEKKLMLYCLPQR